MWVPDVEQLSAADAGNAFLISRWREFFDHSTPDSYQPRIFHLPLLVAEIGSIAEAIQKEAYLSAHFANIQRECRSRILAEKDFFYLCSEEEVAALENMATDGRDPTQVASESKNLLKSGFLERFEETCLNHGQVCLLT